MKMDNQTSVEQTSDKTIWRQPLGIAIFMVILIVSFYLLREHWGHIFGFWPYLILLACPLMHLMHGHGGHHHGSHTTRSSESNKDG